MRRVAADAGRLRHRRDIDAALPALAEQLLELAPSRPEVIVGLLSTLSVFSQLRLDYSARHVRQSDTCVGRVRPSCTLSSGEDKVSDGLTPTGRSGMKQTSYIFGVDRLARA
jgi:hypothetical protein